MLTLERLVKEKAGTRKPAEGAAVDGRAADGQKLLNEILGSFRLGDRELKGAESFAALRARLDAAIEGLR